ncbi:MAG TPA: cation:dicarboxylase symporter family transporter, partial [Methylosinus sp.]
MNAAAETAAPRRGAHSLYLQVLAAIILGALLGVFFPDIAASPWVEALGKGFVKLIKMVIAPIIFCTVVSGIAHIESAAKVGRVGVK